MTEPSTIILIGAARSGTKFLRDILASGTGAAAVPYDVNYVWRYGAAAAADDVLDPATLTDERKRFIQKSLRSLAKANDGDILIEKTVANTLRVPFVNAVFPNARYVHLVRDGREVTESAMRQWRAPPNWSALFQKIQDIPIQNISYVGWFGWNLIKGLILGRKGGKVWGPRFPGIGAMAENASLARICARQWLESYTRSESALRNLTNAESCVFTIRYEDLVRDDTALSKLVDQLGLQHKDNIIATFHKKLKPSRPEVWRNLPVSDQADIDQILTPTLRELGYSE